jgi:hypothetical protein
LCTGITLHGYFKAIRDTTAVSKELLNKISRGLQIIPLINFKIFTGTLKGPAAFEEFSLILFQFLQRLSDREIYYLVALAAYTILGTHLHRVQIQPDYFLH